MADADGPVKAPPPTKSVALLDATLGLISGSVLFVLMTITVVDVVGRYLLNAPLPAGFEMIQIGMALVVFAALPVCTARDEQIRVEVFQLIFPVPARRVLSVVSLLISLVVLVGFCWLLFLRGQSFVLSQETTSNLQVPLAPLAFFMCASWAVCAVVATIQLIRWRQARVQAAADADIGSFE